jgi:hypothetical protein
MIRKRLRYTKLKILEGVNLHKITQSFILSPGQSCQGQLDSENVEYYRKLVDEQSPDWNLERFLGGELGGFVTEVLGRDVDVVIFDNKCVRVTPRLHIKSTQKVKNDADSIVKLLLEFGCTLHWVDTIISDIKFYYGYYSDKSNENISVESTRDSVSIIYKDITKYNMITINDAFNSYGAGMEQNFGGAETLQMVKDQNQFTLNQDSLDPEFTEVTLTVNDQSIIFADAKFNISLTDISWLKYPEAMYGKIGLDVPDFSKEQLSSDELLRLTVVRFILDTVSNVAAHNYKDFDQLHVIWYDGLDIPVLVPEGYTAGLYL